MFDFIKKIRDNNKNIQTIWNKLNYLENKVNELDNRHLVIKIKKLDDKAIIPNYANPGEDAGLDLVATSMHFDVNYDFWCYGFGFAIEIPKGYVGLVFPRSSNRKTNSYLPNSVGVIDSGYRGEVMTTFKQRDNSTIIDRPYELGDKIAQLIILPYPNIDFIITDKLIESQRGNNGHGSTGK